MIRSFKDSRTERLFHGEEVYEFRAFARQSGKRLRPAAKKAAWRAVLLYTMQAATLRSDIIVGVDRHLERSTRWDVRNA